MSNEITLFDLPSRGRCACWFLNPWKTRLVLNFKGLPYKTEWVEYPNLKSKLQGLGVPPNVTTTPNAAEYTIPTVRLPDGSGVMDSRQIATALEALHPQPSLRLDGGYVDRTQDAVLGIHKALQAISLPRIPDRLLNPASEGYFRETREKRFGLPLTEFAKSERAGEGAWREADAPMAELRTILREHQDGPYVLGRTPSYADFIVAALWRFFEILDSDGDLFGRSMKFDGSFPKHYEACKKWLERDDH